MSVGSPSRRRVARADGHVTLLGLANLQTRYGFDEEPLGRPTTSTYFARSSSTERLEATARLRLGLLRERLLDATNEDLPVRALRRLAHDFLEARLEFGSRSASSLSFVAICITSSGTGYTSPSGTGPFAAEGVGESLRRSDRRSAGADRGLERLLHLPHRDVMKVERVHLARLRASRCSAPASRFRRAPRSSVLPRQAEGRLGAVAELLSSTRKTSVGERPGSVRLGSSRPSSSGASHSARVTTPESSISNGQLGCEAMSTCALGSILQHFHQLLHLHRAAPPGWGPSVRPARKAIHASFLERLVEEAMATSNDELTRAARASRGARRGALARRRRTSSRGSGRGRSTSALFFSARRAGPPFTSEACSWSTSRR